jgi:4-hydroxy-3-methylbut-2-en-1-yl diphosphate reductase
MKNFEIPSAYRSSFIGGLKAHRRQLDKLKKDFSPSKIKLGPIEIIISRHFGFCYGVENAVEIAYKTLDENPGRRIFLLSEMIHNPQVNADLLDRGIRFLMDTEGKSIIPFEDLTDSDIVIVPAFGTTIDIQNQLKEKNIDPYAYNTTCPFVEKVWNRSNQISERGYTVIIHGKPSHEETRATFSHAAAKGPALIIKDIKEAKILAEYIKGNKANRDFEIEFSGRFSTGFNPEKHLQKLGVVNQTTMLASETQEIANFLKAELLDSKKATEETAQEYFANTRDTLCYATNDNQEATLELLNQEADFALVIGGHNSSNTTHLVELLEKKFDTYFIDTEDKIYNNKEIEHFDIHLKEKQIKSLPYLNPDSKIIVTCGASCPDATVEKTILKLLSVYNIGVELSEALYLKQ